MEQTETVKSPNVAKALCSSPAPTYLQPFLAQNRSVAEAAALLDEPVPRVHYWVTRLLSLGLLTVVAEIPRAGRTIKLYRSTAQRFLIPATLVPLGYFS